MSGHHPYYNPHDQGGRGHNKHHGHQHQHHQHHQNMQAQAPAFQPGMYHYSQLHPPTMQQQQQQQPPPPQYVYGGAPQHTMPGGYGGSGPVSYPQPHHHQQPNGAGPYYPQQPPPPPQQQQYGQQYYPQQQQQQPLQQHMHHAHHHHHQQPQHQQHQHVNPSPPPVMDPAAAEAEIRKAVEAALATPSLLRGAAAGSGNGGYTFAHKGQHRGGGKQHQQQQSANLLKKISGGALPFDVVCALPPVKRSAQGDRALVQRALEASEAVAVVGGGKQQRVARKDMLPGAPAADLPYRCVTLTRLPGDKANEAGVRALVAAYGEAACVVVVGGEEQEEGDGGDDEEATAAGRGPPMLEVKAVVEFAEGEAAVKCVEALSGGSDWRRGLRAEFTVGGLTLQQAAKHFGVELAGAAGSGGNGEAAASGNGDAAAPGNASSSSSSSAMPASVRDARLPPTFPEGTHTGVVMEMILGFATAAEGGDPIQVQRGVIKREGRVRNQISFELPAAELAGVAGVGERVDFVVKHVENKAVVVGVRKSTAPPPAPLRVVKKEAASSSSTAFVQAKGPDEKGGVGFLLPRTKPTEAMQGLLDSLRQLKLGAATAGKSG